MDRRIQVQWSRKLSSLGEQLEIQPIRICPSSTPMNLAEAGTRTNRPIDLQQSIGPFKGLEPGRSPRVSWWNMKTLKVAGAVCCEGDDGVGSPHRG